eukprot:g15278.t1
MEVGTPTSFLERADKMVTWEEDCAPGLALAATATTAGTDSESRESPKEVENDGSSVASDMSDAASLGKVRGAARRRSSLNQVFLRPIDPLKVSPEVS